MACAPCVRLIGRAILPPLLLIWLVAATGCGLGSRLLFSSSSELPKTPAQFGAPYEDVWFPARDGVMLNGWLVPGDPATPPILYFHGNGGNLSDAAEYLALFHGMGMPVFVFDYRGYGKSSGKVRGENDLYEDGRGAIDYLVRRGWRPEGMIYYGQSLGGAVALQMALETPPAGLALESPFTSLADIARHLTPVTYALLSWCCIDVYLDNLAKISAVTVPLLLLHGDRDQLTPPEMSRLLFSRAREPKLFHLISGGGHCDAVKYGGAEYRDVWRRFLLTVSARPEPPRSAGP